MLQIFEFTKVIDRLGPGKAHLPAPFVEIFESKTNLVKFSSSLVMAKKQPITGKKNVSIKPDRARKLIRKFHVLLKSKSSAEASKDYEKVAAIDRELDKLGGLNTYQKASISGQSITRGGDSSKILVEWLDEDYEGSLLEVGCLHVDNACARSNKFKEHIRIDLNSQHPKIVQQDFMTMELKQQFSVISLSLVVNYVPDSATRGQMLVRAHKFLCTSGLLFFVLPRACVDNSRYCDLNTIDKIMESIGFEKIHERLTAKLVYWLYKKQKQGTGRSVPKKKLRDSPSMNNFAITL